MTYDNTQKIATDQGDDYTTAWLITQLLHCTNAWPVWLNG